MSLPSDLLERALALPDEERIELMEILTASLPPDPLRRDLGWDAAWAEELNRRADFYRADPSRAIPAEEFFEQFRSPAPRKRKP